MGQSAMDLRPHGADAAHTSHASDTESAPGEDPGRDASGADAGASLRGVEGYESTGFIAPRYDTGGLGAVLTGAAGALGVDAAPHGGPTTKAARAALELPAAERVCVVLVDGLGLNMLSERSGHTPTMRGLLGDARTLTAGFPSTTAASMGIFGTGSTPGRTGMLGYTIRSQATGALANMVSWSGLEDPHEVQREPTIFEALSAAGREVTSVGPRRFDGSGMTRAALRGARFVGTESLADRVDATAYELTSPGLSYLYWGDVDKIGHHHGWGSWQWGDALSEFDRELGRLLRSLTRGTLVLVTADHGMIDVDPALRWDVAGEPRLKKGVALVAGEPRATHLYLNRDVDPAVVIGRWRDVLGDHALVIARDEAISRGWFGPVSDHVRDSIGDILVAATGRATIVDSSTQTHASLGLKGVHGSLTPDEMLIPLLVAQV